MKTISNEDVLIRPKVKEMYKNHPDISMDSIVQDCDYGRWGVILYIVYDFSIIGIDFIESETSRKRPEANAHASLTM